VARAVFFFLAAEDFLFLAGVFELFLRIDVSLAIS
jgi:hypothetical protein